MVLLRGAAPATRGNGPPAFNVTRAALYADLKAETCSL